MTRSLDALAPLMRYGRASEAAAGQIIDAYSTSFGTATKLLGPRHRAHVRTIYALVRVADELVDGATAEAGMTADEQHRALDALEAETNWATETGYSSNPIVHAFANTARVSGIDAQLTEPFFASMRTDLDAAPAPSGRPQLVFGDAAHDDYVYGSAEVVGLMCLRVFLRDEARSASELQALEHGARRLGAAFQNVNFLRDLGDDTQRLGRSYLSAEGVLDEPAKQRWVEEIRLQLDDARAALPLLPRDARAAVGAALRLFNDLTARIAKTPVAQLYETRVSVPTARKAWLIAAAAATAGSGRAS